MSAPIWVPSEQRRAASNLMAFIAFVNERQQSNICDYAALHAFSIDAPASFWPLAAEFCDVRFDVAAATGFEPGSSMLDARWFPGARLNIARTLLSAPDDAIAIL